MDPLSALLVHAFPEAKIFFAGNLYQNSSSDDYPSGGHLHLLRSGAVMLREEGGTSLLLEEPTLILFPRGRPHKLEPRTLGGCDLVCANVAFGKGGASPLQLALPGSLVLPLRELPALTPVLSQLFDEAFHPRYGQDPLISRLLEILLILLLRHLVEQGVCQQGMLAGISDPQLAKAISVMHQRGDEPWTVATLAREAGMSRARFAARFQERVGQAPLGYLTHWRMARACQQLLAGEPMVQVALGAGYSSSVAFGRAFERELGMSPGRWLKAQQQAE